MIWWSIFHSELGEIFPKSAKKTIQALKRKPLEHFIYNVFKKSKETLNTKKKGREGSWDCSAQQCKCKKNCLVYTDLYKCLNCMNGTEPDTDELQDVLFDNSDSETDT